MKNIGMTTICMTPMNDCICVIRAATMTPNAVMREREQQLQREDPEDQQRVVGDVARGPPGR